MFQQIKSRTGWLHPEFYQGRDNTNTSQTIQKIKEIGTHLSLLYKVTITLISKPDKDTTKEKIITS